MSYTPKEYIDSSRIATEEPSGFPIDTSNGYVDRSTTSLSWDDATMTLTLSPTDSSYNVWVGGKEVTINSNLTSTITDTEGMWWFYIDNDKTLKTHQGVDYSLIFHKCLVGFGYWDSSNSKMLMNGVLDERHGAKMDGHTHGHIHGRFGMGYESGLLLNTLSVDGSGSSDAHARFGVDSGSTYDEDIRFTYPSIDSTTGITYLYLDSSGNWREGTNAGFCLPTAGSGRLAYNPTATGGLSEVNNGDFVLAHIFATSGRTPTTGQVFCIVGQNQYLSRNSARVGAEEEINTLITTGLNAAEFKFIATIIFQTRDNYSNSVKARVVSTDDGFDYIDLRKENITPSGVSIISTVDFDRIPIEYAEDGTSAPAASELITSGNGNIRVRKFDSSSAEDVIIPWNVPSNINVNAPVVFRVHFVITEATGPSTEGVAFKLSGYSVGDGDALDDTFGTAVTVTKPDMTESQYDYCITEWSNPITITDLAQGELAMLKFERDPSDSDDDYGQDVGVAFIEIEYSK